MKVIILYFIFAIKLIFCSECDRNNPILYGHIHSCQLKYCTEEQFQNGECKINNEIIKTQWLTNIIQIGELNSAFINFANFSDGTMVIEVSSFPGNARRIFFGLKPDGNYLFNNDETHQFIMTASNQEGNEDNKRQYAENFCVQIEEDGTMKE